MKDVFHDIYDILKRNEKEILIGKSGSTKGTHNEKVRSGQSYLYKKYGMESEVIEIRFKKKKSGSVLNQALILANKRYHYVYVSFHHALCDGRGIKPYVETLIYYYCLIRYGSQNVPEGVHLADDPLLPTETVDPFMQEYGYDTQKEFLSLSRDAYAIPENVPGKEKTNYRYYVRSLPDCLRGRTSGNYRIFTEILGFEPKIEGISVKAKNDPYGHFIIMASPNEKKRYFSFTAS